MDSSYKDTDSFTPYQDIDNFTSFLGTDNSHECADFYAAIARYLPRKK